MVAAMRFSLVATLPRSMRAVLAAAVVAVLCGCASGPRRAPGECGGERDGPGANPPADHASRAHAEPRVESIRVGGANKPYQVAGRTYVPETRDVPFHERGLASWYGRKFHGKMTSSGEAYDMYAMTAAHPTLPIPSYARIRNPANGREVIVRINDRGPFVSGRIVDLSYTAASDACLKVVGHTSRTGDPQANEVLSQKRATTIKQNLERQNRKLATRVSAEGVGSREIIVGLGTDDLRDALDRRVEFRSVDCR